MTTSKVIKVPKVPERLRLAWFTGTEAEQAELDRLESDISSLLRYVFHSVNSGAYSCAWWDEQTLQDAYGHQVIRRRALHRSSRHEGLQLSFYDIMDGSAIIPVMHADFQQPDHQNFLCEAGQTGGQCVHMISL